jgi:hypothetical protein
MLETSLISLISSIININTGKGEGMGDIASYSISYVILIAIPLTTILFTALLIR